MFTPHRHRVAQVARAAARRRAGARQLGLGSSPAGPLWSTRRRGRRARSGARSGAGAARPRSPRARGVCP
eukprot:scaffold16620_cov58-Phaeocystis_antarctica.AAC.5